MADYSLISDGDMCSEGAAKDALNTLGGFARVLTKSPYIRSGRDSSGAIGIDLGREDNLAIKATTTGWEVTELMASTSAGQRRSKRSPCPRSGARSARFGRSSTSMSRTTAWCAPGWSKRSFPE